MPGKPDAATRSRMMTSIGATDTGPEMTVRRFLHASGYRYRLHVKGLPGRPDIVLPRWGAVVQVNGCFWHAHESCSYFVIPKTRTSFWEAKLLGNRLRDQQTNHKLLQLGWRVAVVWECALKDSRESSLDRLALWLGTGGGDFLELPDPGSNQLDPPVP